MTRVANRKYGLGDEKKRRAEERKQAHKMKTAARHACEEQASRADIGGVVNCTCDNGSAMLAIAVVAPIGDCEATRPRQEISSVVPYDQASAWERFHVKL